MCTACLCQLNWHERNCQCLSRWCMQCAPSAESPMACFGLCVPLSWYFRGSANLRILYVFFCQFMWRTDITLSRSSQDLRTWAPTTHFVSDYVGKFTLLRDNNPPKEHNHVTYKVALAPAAGAYAYNTGARIKRGAKTQMLSLWNIFSFSPILLLLFKIAC